MTLELKVAQVVAFAVREATAPLLARIAALEARPQPPAGEKGDRGPEGPQGMPGRDGEKGDRGPEGPQGMPGRDGEKGDRGPEGPQGMPGRDGAPAESLVEFGLTDQVITASAEMLLRKELAALEAAAPPRVTKRVVRDAQGKITRVIEEPVRG